jgi:outer membrane receptor protein involved in Fe transport
MRPFSAAGCERAGCWLTRLLRFATCVAVFFQWGLHRMITGPARWFVYSVTHPYPMTMYTVRPCLSLSRRALLGAVLLGAANLRAETLEYYDLPAGDAAEMLRKFSALARREILFSSATVRGLRTSAVQGKLSAREALERMLAGTGLLVLVDHSTGALALRRADAPALAPEARSRTRLRAMLAAMGVAAGNVLFAQATPPPSPGSTQEDSTLVLSPFQVKADQDQGYLATNTLSGSRVNTPLYTTPSVTSVFTRDFLDDIAANDLVEAYAYGLNVDAQEQAEQSSNFRGNIFSDNAVNIRGLNAATARNYFVWSVNGDSYNLERLDFSRGPNNILFGLGGQGGVVNSTTKRAVLNRDITKLQLRVGEWDLYRGHLDINRGIGKNVALRLNLLRHDEGGWKNHAMYDKEGFHIAGTWRVFNTRNFGTTLRAEYEKLDLDRALGYKFPFMDAVSSWNGVGIPASGSLTGVVGTGTMATNRRSFDQSNSTFFSTTGVRRTAGPSGTSWADESVIPRELNFYGPGNRNDSNVETYTVSLEQRLFKDLFVEVAFNRQEDDMLYNQVDGYHVYRDPRMTVDGVTNPRYRQYYADFDYGQRRSDVRVDEQRITASYERDFGKWFGRHQIAGLVSRRENRSLGQDFNFDDVSTNGLLIIRRWMADGDAERFTAFNPAEIAARAAASGLDVGFRQNNLSYSNNRQDTAQIVHVGNFFSGRLSTVYGVRKDELLSRSALNGTRDVVQNDPLYKRVRQWNNFQLSGWNDVAEDYTRTKGFTLGWSADAPVRFYYNESESFVNQSGQVLVDLYTRSEVFPPRVGEGRDMGLRFRLFDKRVQGSIGYFETNDIGQRHFLHGFMPQALQFVARDLLRIPEQRGFQDKVDVSSDGYEFEITANPTRNLRLHFNYSRTNLETSNHGPDAKRILFGEMIPEWGRWVSGWRQGPGEVLPDGVANNTAPAVTVSDLGRPLTFLEAHGNAIDPAYARGSRVASPTATGTLGLADWISRANWSSDIWFQDGMPPRRHRRDSFNVVANYTFDNTSRLKGWTIGASARWRGKPIIDRSFDANSNVVVVWGEDRLDTDLTIAYTRKFERFTLKTQLNVLNVLDANTIEVINVAGNSDERGHLQWYDPRSVRLTLDFAF